MNPRPNQWHWRCQTVTGPVHTVTNAWDTTRDALLSKENKAGTTVVSRYEYGVNSIGQRTGMARSSDLPVAPSSTVGWSYNVRGEVVGAAHSDTAQSRFYQYDPIGNRQKSRTGTATDSGGSLTSYVSNSLNQYSGIGAAAPTYDVDGNQLTGILPADPSKAAGYLWDGENRLLEAKSDGTTVGGYRYDPFGRRIAKTASGTTIFFVYDGWNPIAEYSSPNPSSPISHVRSYLWGQDLSGTMQGAGGVGGLLSTSIVNLQSSIENHYPLYDGNGNVGEYLDAAGTVAAQFEYDPFGKLTVNTDSLARFPIRFSTKREDFETGLNYYGYRYCDPIQGRWMSRDIIEEFGGMNLYDFVKSDSINKWDLMGFVEMTLSGAMMRAAAVTSQLDSPAPGPADAVAVAVAAAGAVVYIVEKYQENDWPVIPSEEVNPEKPYTLDDIVSPAKPSKKTKKERATDVPDWARRCDPPPPEDPKEKKPWLKKTLDEKYGPDGWKSGPGTEFNQILKWLFRNS